MELTKRKLYNVEAPNRGNSILRGEFSGVVNWNDLNHNWVYHKYETMKQNFWNPREISMANDRKQWNTLSEEEKRAFRYIIGQLASLDSIQAEYCNQAKEYIHDPSISHAIGTIEFQEVLHNESYSYIFQSLPIPFEESNKVFDLWRKDEVLKERNKLLFEVYKEFIESKTVENFLKSLIADIILEGLYFYSGFAYFYNLKRHGLMDGTYQMVQYINRDEHIHVGFFAQLFKEITREEGVNIKELEPFAHELFKKASELEVKWSKYGIGQRAYRNVTLEEVEGYIKFYTDYRLKQLGFKPLYNQKTNPLKWISQMTAINKGKVDFFESKSRTYTKVNDINGFDEL